MEAPFVMTMMMTATPQMIMMTTGVLHHSHKAPLTTTVATTPRHGSGAGFGPMAMESKEEDAHQAREDPAQAAGERRARH
mmetsp:Transcript_103827/g.332756  ORF Transcript_103827/g.332756 Transcript_103827/m.332756 type:complete len:80 (+) Transcript_103827:230-469(+)